MKRKSNTIKNVKLLVVIGIAVLGLVGLFAGSPLVERVSGNASGPPASHTNAPGEGNCTACHSEFPTNSGDGNVVISNVPASYSFNQAGLITVTATQTNTVIFGFQITAVDSQGRKAGNFTITQDPTEMQIRVGVVNGNQRQYLEHTSLGIGGLGNRSWTFTWTAPATDVGPVTFFAAANAANDDSMQGGDYIYLTSKVSNPPGSGKFDFDGDGKTDPSIFRPSAGQWWYFRSSDFGNRGFAFGSATDKLVPADFTGDGKTDIALWRPSDGNWYVLRSEDNSFYSVPFGTNGDIPAPGDFDGDGKADTAIYRPANGLWVIQNSSGGTVFQGFGLPEDKPVVEDYDGDGKDDIAVFRPSVSQWWLLRSTDGVIGYQFGSTGDKTVPGDFTGDGKADVALFRPSNGNWFILRSENSSFYSVPFGAPGDIPTAGDYDGDGKTDTAVFRPSDNFWYVQGTTSGFFQIRFGTAGDVPVPSAYTAP